MDANGNYSATTAQSDITVPRGNRAVSVHHVSSNPVGVVLATSKAIAIGTGVVAGYAWKKASTTPGDRDWVQVLP